MKITINIKTEYASGGRKSWWKHITSIDAAQRGGYAFVGSFLNEGEHEVPVGALLLHVTNHGSVKNGHQEGGLLAVEADGSLREIVSGLHWREQSVSLRKSAEAYLASPILAAGLIQPEPAQPAEASALAAPAVDVAGELVKIEGLLFEARSDIPEGDRARRDVGTALDLVRKLMAALPSA